jgi:acylphosphatase
VRNESDGSVRILAAGPDPELEKFISEIDVDMPAGPSVVKIERVEGDSERFTYSERNSEYEEFSIVH